MPRSWTKFTQLWIKLSQCVCVVNATRNGGVSAKQDEHHRQSYMILFRTSCPQNIFTSPPALSCSLVDKHKLHTEQWWGTSHNKVTSSDNGNPLVPCVHSGKLIHFCNPVNECEWTIPLWKWYYCNPITFFCRRQFYGVFVLIASN